MSERANGFKLVKSFFELTPNQQKQVFDKYVEHARPEGLEVLQKLFTSASRNFVGIVQGQKLKGYLAYNVEGNSLIVKMLWGENN